MTKRTGRWCSRRRTASDRCALASSRICGARGPAANCDLQPGRQRGRPAAAQGAATPVGASPLACAPTWTDAGGLLPVQTHDMKIRVFVPIREGGFEWQERTIVQDTRTWKWTNFFAPVRVVRVDRPFERVRDESKAIEYHPQHLAVAKEVAGEGAAYGNLGNAYQSLGSFSQAIEHHTYLRFENAEYCILAPVYIFSEVLYTRPYLVKYARALNFENCYRLRGATRSICSRPCTVSGLMEGCSE